MQHVIAVANWLSPLTTLLSSIAYPFIVLFDAIEKQRKINETFNDLNRLSDRELKDIGIGRSQIMHVAYEYAYGEDKDA